MTLATTGISSTSAYVNFYINNVIVPSGNSVTFSLSASSSDSQRLNLGTNAIITLNPGDTISVGIITTLFAISFRKFLTGVPYILTISPV